MASTIKDVAKLAGVTPGTVSRAFNGYSINKNTKERILQAAEQLNYVPNAMARSLSMKVSPNIGMIISIQMNTNGKDNFIVQMLQGVYRYSAKHNLEINLLVTDSDSQKTKSFETFCTQHNVNGVIISGITVTEPYFEEIRESKIPCVLIDVRMERKGLGYVSVDNRKAEKEVTDYLIEQGHKNIIVIAGKKNTTVNEDRLLGIQDALNEKQLEIDENNIHYCDFSEEKAFQAALKYIRENGKKGATAFLCLSDLMAFGVLRAIKKCGYTVPGDFSVVGFDDHPLSSYMVPPLTTVAQNFEEMGYQSARLLRKLMKNPDAYENRDVSYKIIKRDSVQRI